jgi:manganese/zinc/iron transport system permease protein
MWGQIVSIAIVTAVACALPGVFLVLRGVALLSDAISHANVLGIIGMFLLTRNLHSVWLFAGAVISSMATVLLTELLIYSGKLYKDVAIGLVFPLFFSVGVILISMFGSHVHLDMDMVMLGEIAFAPLQRFTISGADMGPQALWVMGTVLIINILFVTGGYRWLSVATFDERYAKIIKFYPYRIHYLLMIVTGITVVAAFDVVGSLVVVALMVTPAATAYLLTKRLYTMIEYTVLVAIITAVLGCAFAYIGDVSIAGSIAVAGGLIFTTVLCSTRIFSKR